MLVNFLLQLSGLQKYEELLTRINAEVAQRLLNIMPTVSYILGSMCQFKQIPILKKIVVEAD